MADATTPWGITLFDDQIEIDHIEQLFNTHANDLNAALNSASVGFYLQYTTKLAMDAVPGTKLLQHATVDADPTAANNGDYAWDGAKWVYVQGIDQVGTFTFGAFYANHASYDHLILTKQGTRARLRGTATIKQTVTFSAALNYTLGTIPLGFRPPPSTQVFRPAAISPINAGWCVVLPTGEFQFAMLNATTQAANAWLIGVDVEWDVAA